MNLRWIKAAMAVGLASFAMVSTGCAAWNEAGTETEEQQDATIFYDADLSACFAKNEKGEIVEVPCDHTDPHYEY